MMRSLRAPFRLSGAAVAACLVLAMPATVPALAESVALTPAQETLLELQLKDAYKCDLDAILFSRELEVGEQKQLEGRVRCKDQREVDFKQADPNQKFELHLCQPAVC